MELNCLKGVSGKVTVDEKAGFRKTRVFKKAQAQWIFWGFGVFWTSRKNR